MLYDADNEGYPYMKRFYMEATKRKQNYLGDNPNSRQVLLTDVAYPRIQVTFGGNDATRPPMEIDAEQFIAVKGFKAKGKRITTWSVDSITELEPTRFPEPEEQDGDDSHDDEQQENIDPATGKPQQPGNDEANGQLSLFNDEDF